MTERYFNILGRLRIQQLRAFNTVMQTGSITRTAEVLNSTQPTISRQIAVLEETVGFKLFHRKGGGRIVPTEDGKQFHSEIEGTLLGLEVLPGIAHGIRSYRKQSIKIVATMPLLFSNLFISATKRFALENPQVQLRINMSIREQVEATVAGGQADLGLAALPVDHPALDAQSIISTKPVAIVSVEHKLASKSVLEISDLLEENMILYLGKPPIGLYPSLSAEDWLISTPSQIETRHAHFAIRMVAEGLGITVCDPISAISYGDSRIKIIPLRTKLEINYGIMYSKAKEIVPDLSSFIEQIRIEADKFSAKLKAITTIK